MQHGRVGDWGDCKGMKGSNPANGNANLASLFNELNSRLREKSDGLFKDYESVQPEFVRLYLGARRKV